MSISCHSLNKITFKNIYPLPRIDDFLDHLQQAKLFSKLDLKWNYHQVKIKVKYVWKRTFKTRKCLYEWLIIHFGLCNAPANFMSLINNVMRPFLDLFVIVYQDDILIFNNTWKEHISHVSHLLETLKNNQLVVNFKEMWVWRIHWSILDTWLVENIWGWIQASL